MAKKLKVDISKAKGFLSSKTLWVSTIGFIAFLVQGLTGFVVSPQLQGIALAALMFGLRVVTKQEVSWE